MIYSAAATFASAASSFASSAASASASSSGFPADWMPYAVVLPLTVQSQYRFMASPFSER